MKRLWLNRKMILQFMLVFAAFFIMVLIGSIFCSGIVGKNVASYGDEAANSAVETMKAYFETAQTTLENVSFSIECLKNEGAEVETMRTELETWGDWILENEDRISYFSGVYGFVEDEFLDGSRWIPPDDYIPQERPWYIGAQEAGGNIFYCDPYIDARTKEIVLTLSKLIFDESGKPFGVISIDILMTGNIEYINSLRLLDSGYGILLDAKRNIVAHHDEYLIGTPIESVNGGAGGYREMGEMLAAGKDIKAFDFVAYDGSKSVAFYKMLPNKWYVGVISPRSAYYNDVYTMVKMLILVGFVLALLLCALLAFLNIKRTRSDEANKMKTSFLARMSHEIRTPMNAVIGMTELILRKELPQDVYENAIGIKSASLNLLAIINDILDFSKIESGMMEIVESDYLFPSLINDVIGVTRIRLIDKPVQFVVNIDPYVPKSLKGDEIRIRQMLINLLSNAVKYTSEGSISLTVTGAITDNTVMLTMDIADSGIGIKEEDVGKLFGNFVQIDTEKNKGIEGTGLGLAITRSLCRLMGGDITVQSEYGKGSTFTATLTQSFDIYEPFAEVDNPGKKSILLYETRRVYRQSLITAFEGLEIPYASVETIPQFFEMLEGYSHAFISSFLYGSVGPALTKLEKPPTLVLLADVTETRAPRSASILSLPATSLSICNILNDVYEEHGVANAAGASFVAPGAKVLIVDDVTANLKVGEGLMLPYNMEITLCESGRKAIDLISANRYDLVFMDHMMPEMDGIEATGIIRSMEGEYFKKLPIVALTANAVSGMREMFIQNGMDDFLSKPIETAKMNAILEKWIPKEKQKTNRISKQKEEKSGFVEAIRAVPDLSVDKALSIVGGSVKTYERMVKLSVRLLPENIERLNALIESDLPNYMIMIHGVKGVLSNIGAYSLGNMAMGLEELSRQGDREACIAIHSDFIEKLAAFSKAVMDIIERTETASAADKIKGDAAAISEYLPKLREAADSCEMTLASETLSSISQCSYGYAVDNIIKDLAFAFESFDFGKASDLIERLDREISI